MVENTHRSGRHAFGDLTNILCKRPALSDPEKSTGGIKIRRIEKSRTEFHENASNSSTGKGIVFGHLFDGVAKQNFEKPSIFRHTKVHHMAAKAAGLLSKEVGDLKERGTSIDSFDLSDKEQDSSLDSEGEYDDDDDDDDEMDAELPGHFSSSELANKTAANDGGDMPSSSVPHASARTGGSEEVAATKSCACSFCLKAAFMWTDLHYQDARSRLSVLKKSIKLARDAKKGKGNEYAANLPGYNSKRSVGLEFELSQQQRQLFLCTENALFHESAQLHSSFVKLKELRENCKTDLEAISNPLLRK
ncbi:uncharacterized protein LOC120642035 isoform X4 [Panicum virgatum]|uniref:uncharacterized protein LOC120642035 isoform X4 n=1 Tax=Panicum virgatum TaxID=38727 RepID=UPI0019D57D44|nr:uncharacterized protein LOC120642035 isoform X4 [Panicum virgatum]